MMIIVSPILRASNVRGSRSGSLAGILVAALTASHLFFACGSAAAKSPETKRLTARIILEVDIDGPRAVKWCYGAEPTFVIEKDGTVFRYDMSGKLVWKFGPTFEIRVIGPPSCSSDGKTLYFVNQRGTRLAVYSAESGLSEYDMSVPFRCNPGDMMSPDGTTFVLPAPPSLVTGEDVLREKRVLQIGEKKAFWTKDILFLEADDGRHYHMLRTSDLSDIGILELKLKSSAQTITAIVKDNCGKGYWGWYWHGDLQRVEDVRIHDRRLQASQSDEICVKYSGRRERGIRRPETVSILQDGHLQERMDLRNIKDLDTAFSLSPDRRFMFGKRRVDVPVMDGTGKPILNQTRKVNHAVVLEIER